MHTTSGRVSWLPSFLQAAGCGCARSPLGCPGLGLLAEGPSVPQACWRLLAPRLLSPQNPRCCLVEVSLLCGEAENGVLVEDHSRRGDEQPTHPGGLGATGWSEPPEHTLLPENSRLQPHSSTSSLTKGL